MCTPRITTSDGTAQKEEAEGGFYAGAVQAGPALVASAQMPAVCRILMLAPEPPLPFQQQANSGHGALQTRPACRCLDSMRCWLSCRLPGGPGTIPTSLKRRRRRALSTRCATSSPTCASSVTIAGFAASARRPRTQRP